MTDQYAWDQVQSQPLTQNKQKKNIGILSLAALGVAAAGVLLIPQLFDKPKDEKTKEDHKKDADLLERENLRRAMAAELGRKGGQKSKRGKAKKKEPESVETPKEPDQDNVIQA